MRVVETTEGEQAKLPWRISQWVRKRIQIPVRGKLRPFSFQRREYLIPILDRPDPRVVIMIARQSEKSTTQGNKMIALACMIPHYKELYVSPSQTQTRQFSQDRIAQPLTYSPSLRAEMLPMNPDNIHHKVLRNQSSIVLRYAGRSADRARGIPANYLAVDELQDVFIENIPVLEETLSHSDLPSFSAWRCYSGTPKSLDNTLTYYWDISTQTELAVPCRRHGELNRPGTWHWNIVGEQHIGKHGLICDKCGQLLDRFDPMRGWVDGHSSAPFRGYRLPQMLAPTINDDEWEFKVLHKYNTYPRPQFFNEVLALPYEAGVRPLTKSELVRCCDPNWVVDREQMRTAMEWHAQREIFMGVDFGTGEHSWTVVALGTYLTPNRFKIFYIHRFTGMETSTEAQGRLLVDLYRLFNVRVSFGDYGMGMHQNHVLQEAVGVRRHHKLRYVAEAKRRIYWNPSKVSWIGVRDELMGAFINAIKQVRVEFPAWSVFQNYSQDFLNVTSEFNDARQKVVFSHHPHKPDDAFHACLYCLLAACLVFPRPDIFVSVPRPKTWSEGSPA